MGWRDRDYNRGGNWGENYFSNPALILGFSVPFGTWFGVRVRLHFWLLLTFAMSLGMLTRPVFFVTTLGCTLLALFIHDFGHRIAAMAVGGRHDEFMFWPPGGMIFPSVPPGSWPLFAAHIGGIAANLLFGLGGLLAFRFWTGQDIGLSFNPMNVFAFSPFVITGGTVGQVALYMFVLANWALIPINFLPYYWFDGGFLLQSILQAFAGAYQAINLTCIIGMVIAGPMFFLMLVAAPNLMGLIFWALLFSSAYSRRTQLRAEGAGELDAAIAHSAQDTGSGHRPRRPWMQQGWAKMAAKRAAKARLEQARIDAILDKVSHHGMQSLNWWEKRTLRKATQRQQRAGRDQ